MKFKLVISLFALFCMLYAQAASAARFGGGRSYGMQRSYYAKPQHSNYTQAPRQTNGIGQQPAPSPQQPAINSGYQQQPQRSGMGAGTAAVLGAAAGAAGGYMLGKSMANNNGNEQVPQASSTTVTQQQAPALGSSLAATANNNLNTSNIPWGMIAILVVLLILGLLFFRRKASAQFNNQINQDQQNMNNNFMNQNMVEPLSSSQQLRQNNIVNNITANEAKMPDGVETKYFLRQAKGIFLHLQSINQADNIAEVSRYLTPDLYTEMSQEIANNQTIAQFNNLSCQLLNSQIQDDGKLIAAVQFVGMITEEPGGTAKPFTEVWSFVKNDLQPLTVWLVCGIEQES